MSTDGLKWYEAAARVLQERAMQGLNGGERWDLKEALELEKQREDIKVYQKTDP